MNTKDNEDLQQVEDLQLKLKPTAFGMPRCSVCGAGGDSAVARLPRGDVAVCACALHWPLGAITPEQCVREERARIQAILSSFELVFWIAGGRAPSETLQ
jgi:hypothetical protein